MTELERGIRDLLDLYERTHASNVELRQHLEVCVLWMNSREKMVPGMPRICDMAQEALNKNPKEQTDV